MSSFARHPIWYERAELLVERLIVRDGLPAGAANAADMIRRLRRRTEALRKYLDLPLAKPLDTPRRWETGWDAPGKLKALKAALDHHDFDLAISDPFKGSSLTLAAQMPGPAPRNRLILDESTFIPKALELRDAGITLPLGRDEGMIIVLTEELYAIAAEGIGKAPEFPWVDEYGVSLFVQEVLGLPFCPLALKLVK